MIRTIAFIPDPDMPNGIKRDAKKLKQITTSCINMNVTITRLDTTFIVQASHINTPTTVTVSDITKRASVTVDVIIPVSEVFDFLRTSDGKQLRLADGNVLRVLSE